MSKLSDVHGISALSIQYSYSSSSSAIIYANGRNQVPVLIRIGLTDQDGNPLFLDVDELKRALSIVDFSGSGNQVSNLDVEFLFSAGEYAQPLDYQNKIVFDSLEGESNDNEDDKDPSVSLTAYLSSRRVTPGRDIAIQFTCDKGVFNSSERGTSSKQGKFDSVFNIPSKVNLVSIAPKRYADMSDFVVIWSCDSLSEFDKGISDILVRNGITSSNGWKHHGIAYKCNSMMTLSIAHPQHTIVKKEYLDRKSSTYPFGINSYYKSGPQHNDQVDMVYGAPGDNYDTIIYAFDAKSIGLYEGSYISHRKSGGLIRTLWIGEYDSRFRAYGNQAATPRNDYDGMIQVCAVNYRVPESKLQQLYWSNKNTFHMKFYDNFGNEGKLRFFTNSSHWPKLEITPVST